MTSKQIISVLGATGAQGGSVVDALLASGFKVRGITRDSKSSAAEALAKKGVEVVEANVLKPETVTKAIAGSYGFFSLTNFWDKDQMGKETEIGKSLVDAAKEAKITHFVWSTLADVETESKKKYHVPHFTDKAKVDNYVKSAGFTYTTLFVAPFYYQNWGSFFKPQKNDDGSLVFTFPVPDTVALSMGDVRDFGPVVAAAFRNPKGWGHHDVIIPVGDTLTLGDIFKALSAHLGVKVSSNTIGKDVWNKSGPGAEEILDMLEWFHEFGFYGKGPHDLNSGHKAKGSALISFEEFLKQTNLKF